MSVGGRLGTSQTQDLVLLAALGLGAYVIYTVVSGVKKLGAPLVDAAAAAGQMGAQSGELLDSMSDPTGQTFVGWYDPATRSVLFYWLTFPDGNHHLVWGSSVLPDGSFQQDSQLYRIGVDKAGGLRAYAMPVATAADPNFGLQPNVTGGWS